MSDLVLVERSSRVGTVTLNSASNRNALSMELLSSLIAALEEVGDASDVDVVVLRADGPSFCSGADLTAVLAGSMEPLLSSIVDAQELMVTMDKPVVARVQSAVRAGGLGLVAAADLAIAAESSHFALTEVRLGLVAAAVSMTVLHRMDDRSASDYLLTGRVFGGADAARCGLVTRAVLDDHLDSAVSELVSDLLGGSPQGLAAAKQIHSADLRAKLKSEKKAMVELSARLFATPEAQNAVRALLTLR